MTLYALAARYIGEVLEIHGSAHNHPLIQWWLMLCGFGADSADEVPWCSAFLVGQAWTLKLPRSRSAAARSWMTIGASVPLRSAQVGFDVVVLKRGKAPQPGPEVLAAPGHVGLFAGWDGPDKIKVLGGNQSDGISVASFAVADVLAIRRLA